jgi:hypothetical protein
MSLEAGASLELVNRSGYPIRGVGPPFPRHGSLQNTVNPNRFASFTTETKLEAVPGSGIVTTYLLYCTRVPSNE